MAKKYINIETGYEKAGVINREPAAGQTINTSMWFSLDSNGKAIVATNAHRLVFLCFAGMEMPSVFDPSASLATGALTGVYGKLIVEVGVDGYDVGGTYALDTALKIENGKVVNGTDGTDIIVGRCLGAVVDSKLKYAIDVPVVVAGV